VKAVAVAMMDGCGGGGGGGELMAVAVTMMSVRNCVLV
jgi:hypothetical protein